MYRKHPSTGLLVATKIEIVRGTGRFYAMTVFRQKSFQYLFGVIRKGKFETWAFKLKLRPINTKVKFVWDLGNQRRNVGFSAYTPAS
jgi:hypothetical protein